MNFKTKLIEMLVANGLSDRQAEKVMDALMSQPRTETTFNHWEDNVDAYPPVMLQVLWAGAKRQAIIFIEKEIPEHWAKPMFME